MKDILITHDGQQVKTADIVESNVKVIGSYQTISGNIDKVKDIAQYLNLDRIDRIEYLREQLEEE